MSRHKSPAVPTGRRFKSVAELMADHKGRVQKTHDALTARITAPRPVDFNDPVDHLCCLMAANGASNLWISKKTGLTVGQITYRLKKSALNDHGLGRASYRNGTSLFAKRMFKHMQATTDDILLRHLRAQLKGYL